MKIKSIILLTIFILQGCSFNKHTVLGTNFNDIIVYKTTCDRVYDGSPNIQKCVDVARKECPGLKIIKSGWEKNTYPGYNSGGYFYEILYECPESY